MDKDILKFVSEEVEMGYKVSLSILTEISGSSPGKSGAIMAISESGKRKGTVGGGSLENSITIDAKKAIEKEEDLDFEYNLGASGDLGMVCGGYVKGYTKIFYPKNNLIIVGAGHVGKAIYDIATTLDFDITVIDDRSEYANVQSYPNANIVVGEYKKTLEELNTNKTTAIVIVTRGHIYDKVALEKLINKESFYIGMIGSKNKVFKTLSELKKDKKYEKSLDKLYAPIGLDMGSNRVKEIALGILCEIYLIKNGKKPMLMRDIYNEKIKNSKK